MKYYLCTDCLKIGEKILKKEFKFFGQIWSDFNKCNCCRKHNVITTCCGEYTLEADKFMDKIKKKKEKLLQKNS
jgi:hypothetical protein